MRTATEIIHIQEAKNILKDHNRQIVDDGRTLALVHQEQGKTVGIQRHRKLSELVSHVMPVVNDHRLQKFI
jgi:hypothetical protein